MRFFLQLAFILVLISYKCQAHSEEEEEEEDSSELNHTDSDSEESEEIVGNQNRNEHSEKGIQKLEKVRGNQNASTKLSKNNGRQYDLNFEIRELKDKLKDQNRWNDRYEQKVGELKETQKNQDKWLQNTNVGIKELKQILEKLNRDNRLNTALQKLKEINENQINLKETIGDHSRVNFAEIKQMIGNQNSQLQNCIVGRRNLTVLGETIEVLMEPNGWIVIQSRFNGSVDFFRNWDDYRNGFGSLDGEFWLGLENIYLLTASKNNELLVQIEDFYGEIKYAHYKKFAIDSELSQYKLATLESYSGTAGDSLVNQRGQFFATYDKEEHGKIKDNCANQNYGAWWYNDCHGSNLNGLYGNRKSRIYMTWRSFSGDFTGLKTSKMMIREAN